MDFSGNFTLQQFNKMHKICSKEHYIVDVNTIDHRLRTPREEIAFTALHGWIFTPTPKFLGTIEAYFVCHIGPNFSDIFDLCLHCVSAVRAIDQGLLESLWTVLSEIQIRHFISTRIVFQNSAKWNIFFL